MGSLTRRAFLAGLPVPLLGGAWRFVGRRAGARQSAHPEPRAGIDAHEVLTDEQLVAAGAGDDVREIFAHVREMPEVVDGIHCYCGCALLEGFRSLLVCYSKDGMAQGCAICQGEGKLVYRRWKEGQSLAQIRRAIDARFA